MKLVARESITYRRKYNSAKAIFLTKRIGISTYHGWSHYCKYRAPCVHKLRVCGGGLGGGGEEKLSKTRRVYNDSCATDLHTILFSKFHYLISWGVLFLISNFRYFMRCVVFIIKISLSHFMGCVVCIFKLSWDITGFFVPIVVVIFIIISTFNIYTNSFLVFYLLRGDHACLALYQ